MIRSQTWSRAIAVTAAQLNVRFTSDGASRVKGDVDAVGKSVANSGRNSQALGAGFLGMGAGIAGGFGLGIRAAMSFEQGMANVQSVSGATGAEFDALSDAALRIGKDTSFSANEATLAIEELSKAGVSVEDILSGAADGATALAAATGTELPQAAAAVATSLNVFSLSGDQATRVANVFAAGANKAATDVGQLQAGLAQGGAVFAMYGMTVEESVGALALFSDYGIQGSDAATSMKAALTTMNSGVGASAKEMAKLGIEMYDANGEFVGMDGLAAELQRTLGGLSEEERNLALTRLGGTDGMRALNILYQEGAAGVDDYTAAVTGTDAATAASAIRMDTLSGAMEALKGSVETLMIVFLSGLLPGIRVVVDAITGFTNFLIDLPGPVQGVVVGLTALAGVVATLGGVFLLFGPQIAAALGILGGISFGPIIAGVAAVAGVAALVYAAWRSDFGGLQRLTQRAFSPITGMIDRFRDTWDDLGGTSDVLSRFFKGTGQAAAITGPIDAVSRALSALGSALRRINDDDTPAWILSLANGLDRAAGFVQRFKTAWDDLSGKGSMFSNFFEQTGQAAALSGNKMAFAEKAIRALDIASGGLITRLREMSAVDIGSWVLNVGVPTVTGWIVTAAGNVWDALKTAAGWAWGGLVDLGSWVLNTLAPAVTGWILGAASNVWSWLKTAVGWVGVTAADLGSWILNTAAPAITGWILGAASNVWSWLKTAVGWVGMTAADLGSWTLNTAVPAVTGWISWAAGNVWSWLKTAVGWVGVTIADLGSWVLNTVAPAVSGWVQWAAGNVWSWLKTAVGWVGVTAADLGAWVLNTAAPAVSGWISWAAGNVWSWLKTAVGWVGVTLANLGSWVLNTIAPTVGGWISWAAGNVWTWLKTAVGWVGVTAADLGSWILNTAAPAVTGWISWAAGNVWSWLKTAAGWAWDGLADIGTITLNIAGWIVTAAEDAWTAVKRFVTGGGNVNRPGSVASGASAGSVGLSGVLIDIMSWAKGAWADLTTWVNEEVVLSYNGNPEGAADPGTVYVKVATFEVEVDAAALNTKINESFKEETLFTAADEAAAQQRGENIGRKVWNKIQSGISGAFSLGGGGGGGGENSRSGIVGMSAEVRATINGFFDGIFEGIGDDIPAIPPYDFSQKFDNMFSTLSDNASGAWDTAVAALTFDIPDIEISAPNVTWPDLDFSIDSLPMYTRFKAAIATMKSLMELPWGDALSIVMPDITWPSFDFAIDDIPFYTDAKAVIQSIIDWFKDPWGGSISVGAPQIDWPGMPGMPGGGASDADILAQLGPRGGSGGGEGDDLEASRNIQGAGGMGAMFQMPNFGPILTGIQNLKSEMQSTITVAGSLKTAIASISSGGGIGAAVGAGASGAAGAAMAAVGGGGGPFAALKTGADQLKTTIASLSTALTTFNAGPLTTLNAGFPILGATVAAFNAGPLTLLNAGFPILAATMTAFNAGPLTLLNAGFPILAATMTAFNAGPLTLLNAGFPILAATMTAFNAGPLTLLNAGFPILSATMTAFNAGPLTLLNAGFPILAATMTAFNAGPLTLLNAGFPILAATMTAFNAGPLTLLNAGFPILAATMTAFNAGPLTLLNAGFPILSATILAFNAGPLTTLNAAFPILTATMLAFNAGPLTLLNAGFPILGATMAAFNAGPLTALNAGFPILGATILAFNAGPLTTLNAGFPIVGASATALGATLNTVGANVTTFGATVTTMSTNVSSGFAEMSSSASSNMAALSSAVQTGMSNASSAIRGEAGQWPGLISGFAGAMRGAGQAVGAAASAGVAAGMRSNLGSIRSAANEIVSNVDRALRAGARIASPSQMTAEVGAMLTTGVAVGMDSQLGIVRGAAASLAIAGIPNAAPPVAGTTGVGGQMGVGVANGILGQAGAVTSAAISVVANAIAAAKHAAGIASPAKRMMPVGVYMDDGLAQGIVAGQSTVIAAAVQTVQRAIAAARAAASSGGGGGLQGVYGAGNRRLGQRMGSMGGAIVGAWEKLTDGFWKSVSSGVIKKGIRAEDGSYVNPGFYAAGMGAGTAFGNGVAAGARSSLQINSPSRVLSELGVYSAQGFMRGVERAYVPPRLDFAPATPSTPTAARGAQYGANAQGGITVNLGGITIQGNVTAEDDLKMTIVRAVNEGIVEGTRQRNRAMGVV